MRHQLLRDGDTKPFTLTQSAPKRRAVHLSKVTDSRSQAVFVTRETTSGDLLWHRSKWCLLGGTAEAKWTTGKCFPFRRNPVYVRSQLQTILCFTA